MGPGICLYGREGASDESWRESDRTPVPSLTPTPVPTLTPTLTRTPVPTLTPGG